MKHNLKNRLIALLLLSALILPSCAADTPDIEYENEGEAAKVEETTPETTLEDVYPLPTVNYDGKSYDMLVLRTGYWGQDYNDLYLAEDDIGDTVGSAAYQRALTLEEKFGMKFVQTESVDAAGQAYNLYSSGDDTYELIHEQAVRLMPTLGSNGALNDINTMPGMTLDAPWYNQKMNNSSSILGKLYMIGGDAISTDKNGIFAMLYNKQMAVNFGIPDLYETVSSGKWTVDLLREYGEMVTNDENGDGVLKKEDDRFGLVTEPFFGWFLMVAAGHTSALKDENDVPYFTAGSEAAVDAIIKMQEIMYNPQIRPDATPTEADYSIMFDTGRALFLSSGMSTFGTFRDVETDFGIIPIPKYDEAQKEYYSTFSPFGSRFVGFPLQNADVEFMGTVFELLSRYGTDTVKTAYYDVLLSGKVARDQKSTEMLDIIFDNMIHDIGATYNWGNVWFSYNDHFATKSENWASMWQRISKPANMALEKTLKQIRSNSGEETDEAAE